MPLWCGAQDPATSVPTRKSNSKHVHRIKMAGAADSNAKSTATVISAPKSNTNTPAANLDSFDIPLSPNAITDIVHYKAADSIALNINSRQAYLFRQGDIHYQDMNLTADSVAVDFNMQTMTAASLSDSNGSSSAGKPVFRQADAEYIADTIRFNYNTKRGIISSVITQEGDGYLHGDKVKKMNDSIMYLSSGKYTTCNYAHPHYSMNFTKSKMIMGDKMVSGPAYLTIEDVPTPIALPFAFFPLTHGRSSGIIIPSYGWMDSRGYYLHDGGYYWAINDNIDLTLLAEIYTNLSWELEAKSQYYRRYKHRGNFDMRYGNTIEGLKGDPNAYNTYSDFKISWQHQQDAKANPYSRFSADVNLQSRNYNRNTTNRNDYFSSTTTSSISYSGKIGNHINIAASARESFNAQTGLMNIKLPSLSLNTTTFYPLRRKSVSGSYRWYENISLSYTLAAENNINAQDSEIFTPAIFNKMNYGLQHNIPISSSIKVLKFFNWTNSINITERWHWRSIEKTYDTLTGMVITDTIKGFRANHDASFSSSISTRIYGIFNFKRGWIKAFRHVINPSISFNLHPDFGKTFHYWKGYRDSTGYEHRYSIFEQSLYGGPVDGRSGQIRFAIGNNLEMKVGSIRDTTLAPTKITLLENLNISAGYDLARDSLNWSDLSISARTTLFKCIVLNFSGSYSPYVIDQHGRKYNKFLWETDNRLFQRQNSNYSANISYSFNNQTFQKSDHKEAPKGEIQHPIFQTPYSFNPAVMMGTYVDFSVPWNLSVNYSLTYVNSYVASQLNYQENITQTLSISGNFSLTEKWKFAFSTGYDFANKGLSYTSVDIYRDLHCWEMRFNWVPFGYYKSWNFMINIKASSLKDLKYEKRRSYLDNQGYYTY
ncbi:MAG: LPS-assembly protein LptD [Bacteroidales bacterium]|nr:LPS-assembly protein LptD [Candidatus Colimorpha onthohippi]